MGAVLSAISAPTDQLNLPAAAPPVAVAATSTPSAPLPTNDLRRSLKRRYEPLELVSTTAPTDILPRRELSSSKKRSLRAARSRRELRLQAHAATAQINTLSAHGDKLDRIFAAFDTAMLRPNPTSADPPPPAYLPAAAASLARPVPRSLGVEAFLSNAASQAAAFDPFSDDHALLRRHGSSASSHPCAVPLPTAPRHFRRQPPRRSALNSRHPRRPPRHPCGRRTSTPSVATSSSPGKPGATRTTSGPTAPRIAPLIRRDPSPRRPATPSSPPGKTGPTPATRRHRRRPA
jgi:hypothetical protein